MTLRGLPGAGDRDPAGDLRSGRARSATCRTPAPGSSLRSRRGAIGVLLRDLHNAFFADVVDGLNASMRERGFHVLMAFGDDLELERSVLHTFRGYWMDGAVLIGPEVSEREIEAFGASTPTVVVGRAGAVEGGRRDRQR